MPASTIAARLAAWVIARMPGNAPAFGIVAPVRDGVVMFLRGAVWCTVTEGGSTRELSGEQALTWVDQIVPGTFEQLAIGAAAGQPVQADPLSDLRDGVVPGQGFVLTRAGKRPRSGVGRTRFPGGTGRGRRRAGTGRRRREHRRAGTGRVRRRAGVGRRRAGTRRRRAGTRRRREHRRRGGSSRRREHRRAGTGRRREHRRAGTGRS